MSKLVSLTSKKLYPEPEISAAASSVCSECATVFKQEWNAEIGEYSEFKMCPHCRATYKPKESLKKITLDYEPHKYQRLVHQSKKRFKVIAAGARGGKDYCCVVEFFSYLMRCANEDRPSTLIPKVMGWIIAPTETIARQNWRDLKRVIPKELIADESRSTGQITLLNGVLIELHSAYDPESLVAVALDCVLITEAARIKDLDVVWDNLEMRLNSPWKGVKGFGGMGLVNSSPLGKNYFYKMFQFGRNIEGNILYDPDWESFHWTTWDNPYMAIKGDEVKSNGKTYKQNLRNRMSDTRYRQDILAEFLANKFAVFPAFERCLEEIPFFNSADEKQAYIDEWRSPKPYMTYSIGYDPASIGDDPIMWIVEDETGKVMQTISMSGMGWDAQFDNIAMYAVRYNNACCKFGRTGHETIDSQLIKRGISTIPLNEQGSNKADLVENLARIVENRQLIVLDDGSDNTEMVKIEFGDYVRDKKGNTVTFHNETSDGHDDHVSAAYFAFSDKKPTEEAMPYSGLIGGIKH
jgi:hypothetical protein